MPKVVVFDSGLGGLSVYKTIASVMKPLNLVYFADFKGFPYSDWEERALIQRITKLAAYIIDSMRPDVIVIAGSSASSLALTELQQLYPNVSFVGTSTGIKQAAEVSQTGMISVLTTQGAARRAYRSDIVFQMVPDKEVSIIPTRNLTQLIEACLQGNTLDRQGVIAEITPAFIEDEGKRTDTIVLGSTHFPLVQKQLAALAPWQVNWVEPSMLIAKRLYQALGGNISGDSERIACHTFSQTTAQQAKIFSLFRFTAVEALDDVAALELPVG